jgi:hypothetical protein
VVKSNSGHKSVSTIQSSFRVFVLTSEVARQTHNGPGPVGCF